MAQFFEHGELVKTHIRVARGKQTDLADYPPEKIAFHVRTPAWGRKKAAGIGPACQALIGGPLGGNPPSRLRAPPRPLPRAAKPPPPAHGPPRPKAPAAPDPAR